MLNWDDPLAAPPPPKPEPVALEQAGQNQEQPAQANPLKPAAYDVKPVNPDDKRVINGMTDINQLAPFKYPWAWDYFLNANKNHWTPLDINMAQDVHDYQHKLTLEQGKSSVAKGHV